MTKTAFEKIRRGLQEAIATVEAWPHGRQSYGADDDHPRPDKWANDPRTMEVYQIVGVLASDLDIHDHPEIQRVLDLLAYGRTKDGGSLMPFVTPKPE